MGAGIDIMLRLITSFDLRSCSTAAPPLSVRVAASRSSGRTARPWDAGRFKATISRFADNPYTARFHADRRIVIAHCSEAK
jgi:hypothetical protein